MAANAALLLVAGGLVAALFLVVLLLVDGWGMSPAAAGLVVTVMPLTAIAVGRLRPRRLGAVQGVACGVILLAGGLAALALLPSAGWAWTIPPQILVGAGLGLTVGGLTELALRGRPDQVVHGGWTLSARHAGVVLGLVLLAPVLTTALDENRDEAIRAGAAIVLDSEIPPLDKLGVAQDVLAEVDRSRDAGELPRRRARPRGPTRRRRRVARARRGAPGAARSGGDERLLRPVPARRSAHALRLDPARLRTEAERREPYAAVSRRDRSRRRRRRPYAALGGGQFEPTPVADPCQIRDRADAEGLGETIERIALEPWTASRASWACRARTLVLALRSEEAFDAFAAEHGIERDAAEQAIRDGLVRAVDDAEQDGTLPDSPAPLVRKAAESVPPWLILETLERLGSLLS